MSQPGSVHEIEINGGPVRWDLDQGRLTLLGLPSALLWLDPSLLWLLRPLVEEIGAPLFRLLVAERSSMGADADYKLISAAATFEDGFFAWERAIVTAGWGRCELQLFDREAKRAVVRSKDPWELWLQRESPVRWGCPFLQGKVIGIFSRAFEVNCWADEVATVVQGDSSSLEFHVYPSDKTIPAEIARLRREHHEAAQRALEQQTREALGEKLELIERQQETIRSMATPILHVWDGVLALPIVGVIDSARAGSITDSLLQAIVTTRVGFAILDLTGVDFVDTAVAAHLIRIVQAVELVGAECLVSGIQPSVAQTIATLGTGLGRARTFATMRTALMSAIETG